MNQVYAAALVASVALVGLARGQVIFGVLEDRKLVATDADGGDRFGESVAVSGATAVVGAPEKFHSGLLDAGSVYVFDVTTGQQIAELVAGDAARNDRFGYAVTVSETTLVVGAPFHDHSGLNNAGAAYVFDLTTGQQVAKLTASNAGDTHEFGSAVAASGTTVVVGAPRASGGRAYVFDLTTGHQVAQLLADDNASGNFGDSLALSGTTAVVGAPRTDHSGVNNAGSAYVFDLTTGQQVARFIGSDPEFNDRFGDSVAVSGTTVVVGASGDNDRGWEDAGSAYMFDLTTGQQIARLTARDPDEGDEMGVSVAVSGTTVAVGAFGVEHSGFINPGAVYLFDLNSGDRLTTLTASDPGDGDFFGRSVAITESAFVAGARSADSGGVVAAGAAYVLDLEPPCSAADVARNFGVVDLSDLSAFITGFVAQQPIADLAPSAGVFDLTDIDAFVSAYVAGCP